MNGKGLLFRSPTQLFDVPLDPPLYRVTLPYYMSHLFIMSSQLINNVVMIVMLSLVF